MSEIDLHHKLVLASAVALPEPRTPIAIRLAELKDIKFIDALQRKHSRAVGWMPTAQLETNIAKGRILIAQDGATPVAYCISNDRYFKRDDCGIVYQLNVVPTKQRGLIGASLIKAVFDRAAYGCKLFCCWCAQDLQANKFWESVGFVPLAFRTGSRSAGSNKTPRIHIFWQRRIREGDTETPYWFPSETCGGAIKENRLVLPIPPGTHWSDAKPAVLPGGPGMENVNVLPPGAVDPSAKKAREPKAKGVKPPSPTRPKRGLWFAPPKASAESKALKAEKPKRPREKPLRFTNDPKVVAAARELRDRYLEQMNAPGDRLLPGAHGKYDVSRQLDAAPRDLKSMPPQPPPQLSNAA